MTSLNAIYQAHALLLFSLVGVFGLMVGSFLNVVIIRLPKMLEQSWRDECAHYLAQTQSPNAPPAATQNDAPYNLFYPRSQCPRCGCLIRAWENIPVLSYILLKGRCRHCHTSISPRYPLVEITSATLACFVLFALGPNLAFVAGVIFTWMLLSLALIDQETQLLPDSLTLPLLWLGLAFNTQHVFTDLSSAVYGAIAGYLILWSIYWLFKVITGKEGMGYGDFKLMSALGAWMGWQMLPVIILLSSALGSIVGIAAIVCYGRDKNIPFSFGPFIALAGWIALFWGQAITDAYLSL